MNTAALIVRVQSERIDELGLRARSALDADGQNAMADAGGRAVKLLLVNHFTDLEAERHRDGGEHFYADAARAVQDPETVDGVALIAINKIGLAQRIFGGTIRAGANVSSVTGELTKYIAIPAEGTDAVGHTPADFPNLKFFKTKRGGGLKLQREVASVVGHIRTGKNKGKSRNDASILGDVVMFWLVPEVTQAADPTVLPDDDAMQTTAFDTMDKFLTRRLASGN